MEPVFTLPACAHAMQGPSAAATASAKAGAWTRPCWSVGHAYQLPLADAEHAQRDEHRGVHLVADDHRHGRAAGETVAVRGPGRGA